MARSRSSNGSAQSSAHLGFEAKLWLAADNLRSNMDAAVPSGATSEPQAKAYKYVVNTAPKAGRIYDPACGSGGMFVQSEYRAQATAGQFVESPGGKLGDISIYGQESNATTRRLAVMNLALRGIEADFGPEHADTFRRDLHPDLRADYVLANPPFNDSDWFRQDDDVRWTEQQRRWSNRRLTRRAPPCSGVKFDVPPRDNANFAWVQHSSITSRPHGMAGFVLANGSMSSNQSGEGDIRRGHHRFPPTKTKKRKFLALVAA